MSTARRTLGVFSIAMITAGSVDSIRNLPATALFGSSVLFFFTLAALLFLLPCALVAAELGSTIPDDRGVYSWVKTAFGLRAGFLAIWFQWVENLFWYPTILSFIAGTIGFLISPELAHNQWYLISVILASFWGMTILNLFGMKSSANFANFCSLVGLILPMVLIIALGVAWVVEGHPLQTSFRLNDMLPHPNSGMWVALTGIILSYCGMEIACVHSGEVKDPQTNYPKAMLLATLVIFITLVLGSLAIAIVLPQQQISLVAGIMQAFSAFFSSYHLAWILPLVAFMLVVGALGGVNNWIIAPTRGLQIAMRDGGFAKIWSAENRYGAPYALLIAQALIASTVSSAFLFMPSVNGAYWLLTALASILYMLMYLYMFAAGIKLRYVKTVARKPGFRIPGGNLGMWLVGVTGFLGSLGGFIVGFMPPTNINIGSLWHYEMLLVFGTVLMSLPPFFMHRAANKNFKKAP